MSHPGNDGMNDLIRDCSSGLKLQFEERSQYGKLRYFPTNPSARALVDLTKRKCLNEDEIEHLRLHGFELEVSECDRSRKVRGVES